MAQLILSAAIEACKEVAERRRMMAQTTKGMDELCCRVETVEAILLNMEVSGSTASSPGSLKPLVDRLITIVNEVNRLADELEQLTGSKRLTKARAMNERVEDLAKRLDRAILDLNVVNTRLLRGVVSEGPQPSPIRPKGITTVITK